MAINPSVLFPTKTAAPSADYPYGGARNVTLPGDATGTPWKASVLNDMWGFNQALLSAAGLVPSGSSETALVSQYLEAHKNLFGTYASVAAMKASNIKAGVRVATRSYNNLSPTDTFGAAYYLIVTAAEYGATPDDFGDHLLSTGNVAVLQLDRVEVPQLGVTMDGVTDDTVALQAACVFRVHRGLSRMKSVWFPPLGVCRITIPAGSIEMPQGCTLITDTIFRDAAAIIRVDTASDKTVFRIRDSNCGAVNMYIDDANSGVRNNTLFYALRDDKLEDIDMILDGCHVDGFFKAIKCFGRGVYARRNTISRVGAGGFVDIDRDAAFVPGANPDQKEATGLRGYQITNNRFHANGTSPLIISNGLQKENVRGIQFNDNYSDTPNVWFLGACRESQFNDNIQTYGGPGLFDFQGDIVEVDIKGNTATGLNGGSPASSLEYFAHAITGSGSATDVTISGNTFGQVREDIVKFAGNSTRVKVFGNKFPKALDGNATGGTGPHYLVNFQTQDTDCQVFDNDVSMDGAFTLNDSLISPSGTSVGLEAWNNTCNQTNIKLLVDPLEWTPVFANAVATYNSVRARYQSHGNMLHGEVVIDASVTLPDASGFGVTLPISTYDQAVCASIARISGETQMLKTGLDIKGFGVVGNALVIMDDGGQMTYDDLFNAGNAVFRISFTCMLDKDSI